MNSVREQRAENWKLDSSNFLFSVLKRHVFRVAPGKHLCRIEKACRGQMDFNVLVALVFPEPTVDAGAGRSEGAVRFSLADFVVQFVAVVIVRVRFLIGLAMKLEHQFARSL